MFDLYNDALSESVEYNRLSKNVRDGVTPISVFGVSESAKMHMAASLAGDRPLLFIAQNMYNTENLKRDFEFFTGKKAVVFPARDFLLQAQFQSSDAQYSRIKALDEIMSGASCVIMPIECAVYNIMPQKALEKLIINIKKGKRYNFDDLAQRLISCGYSRQTQLSGRGEFNIHGGIIDIFPYEGEFSLRIDFFDDEVESIRTVDPVSQRSVESVGEVKILPIKETCAEKEKYVSAAQLLSEELRKFTKQCKNSEAVRLANDNFTVLIPKIESGDTARSDNLFSYIYPEFTSVFDYLPQNVLTVFDEINILKERSDNIEKEFSQNLTGLLEQGAVLPRHGNVFCGFARFFEMAKKGQVISLQTITGTMPGTDAQAIGRIQSRTMQSFHGKADDLIREVKLYQNSGYKIVLCAGSIARQERLEKEFSENAVGTIPLKRATSTIQRGQIAIITGSVSRGFEYPDAKFAIIGENDIFHNNKRKTDAPKQKRKSTADVFVELKIGDAVVHENNGIGIYQGIVKITTDGVQKDYLYLKYRDEDKLYVPVEQMNRVQKYIAPDDNAPKLNKLGTQEWTNTKARVKKSIIDMTDKLLKLYRLRENTKGYQFLPDTPWQRDFEEDFPYEETPDQVRCIDEIKADMESSKAMDRLLCGDVGYGKTEVALRAVFKAVMSGKQAAVLAPTTILAQQHFNTFKNRLLNFSAVKVELLSRFRSAKEQKQVIKELAEGKVDILVGTHRILAKDVVFKDLGLLVVDEEQRFGVAHKEKIKELKANIDVLTLSATPIPRTLNMALSGIRDMSLLETPPLERYPVQTYVLEYSDVIVREAIMRELSRGGQAYYLYNRVQSIDSFAVHLHELVPEARIAVAHGQMEEKQLEKIMLDFCNGEYDVLLCTTIIENGVDIPGANTLIVQNSERFGLSQLYQLRGRVGRSNKTAYAYFTVPQARSIGEDAHKRLSAIEEFTQMGSGFKIAMRDLEIRGAGSLLGGQQHGHMAKIGYDLYCKMIKQTVDESLGRNAAEAPKAVVELKIDAFISEEYISNESVRFSVYRKISDINTKDDMLDVFDELKDRFGEPDENVNQLLKIAYIRSLAGRLGATVIRQDNGKCIMLIKNERLSAFSRAASVYSDKCYINANRALSVVFNTEKMNNTQKLELLCSFLESIEDNA